MKYQAAASGNRTSNAKITAASSANPSASIEESKSTGTGFKQPKNVLGLDFEMPEELSQMLAEEIQKQQAEERGDLP